ncbi:MAG: hypothetical protein PHE27_04075, partial [Alphaproteobacteria bacterium]|nr:hypothetical protein [Alphaproteobacteria bacterium]
LVGSHANDQVGYAGVTALTNGNYVVDSYYWNSDTLSDIGAVSWGNGATGISGIVSSANSLVGSHANDQVGYGGVTALTNGNYVVDSYYWDSDTLSDIGAVTWADGTTGITGVVSSANSLVGSHANDRVGYGGVTALTNGNYVVVTRTWDNDTTGNVGAVTWGNGATGTTGIVSSANSLVGSHLNDYIGYGGVTALTNGNYVVSSYTWDSDTLTNVGAVTWGNGATGTTGIVSSANSLVGTTANDRLGLNTTNGVVALANGDYVVRSKYWNNAATSSTGVFTWGNGTTGITGEVSSANSILNLNAVSSLTLNLYYNSIKGSFLAAFYDTGSLSSLSVGLINLASLTYSIAAGKDLALLPSFLTDTLNQGTSVTLQANNNITVNSDIVVTPSSGDGGSLTLQAGNSILINADITTANGDLTLVANATAADGVLDAYRDAGDASITMADGTTLNAGTGSISISLLDGAGNTYNAVGSIALGSLLASSVSITSLGGSVSQSGSIAASTLDLEGTGGAYVLTNAGNDIDILVGDTGSLSFSQASGLTLGNGSSGLSTSGDMLIVLTDDDADLTLANAVSASETGDALVLVSGRNFINNGGSLSVTGGGRWLVYSTSPSNDTLNGLTSAFWRYGSAYGGSCPSSGNGFLYSFTPTLTVTPTAFRLTYADPAPDLSSYSYTISGYLGSDASLDTLMGSLTGSTLYAPGSPAGRYAISYLNGSLSSAMGYAFAYDNNLSGILVLPKQIPDTVSKNSQKPALPSFMSATEDNTKPGTLILAAKKKAPSLNLNSNLSIRLSQALLQLGLTAPWEN